MTNENEGHGGHTSDDKPRCEGVMAFASVQKAIQKAILSAIDISKIDKALTGATDEEKNIELGRRIGDFFTQIVTEFQGKGEGRFEFGNAINRTVSGFLANTVKEIERLSKRVAELEEQLRTADDKSREELSSQLDPLLEHEAQLMKYVKDYANLARTRDWETIERVFDAPAPEERRREVAERFAARRNAEQATLNRIYQTHANVLNKLRGAEKFGLTTRDLHRDLLQPIDVASWWDDALARQAEAERKKRADEGGGDTPETPGVTPVDGEVGAEDTGDFADTLADTDSSLTDEDGTSELINLDWKEDMTWRRSLF